MPGCQRPRTDGPAARPSGSAHHAAGEAALRSDPGAPPAILQRLVRAPLAIFAPNLTPHPLFHIMAIGHGILILSYFTTRDAIHLRGVHRELRQLVTNFAWDERDPGIARGSYQVVAHLFPPRRSLHIETMARSTY